MKRGPGVLSKLLIGEVPAKSKEIPNTMESPRELRFH